MRLTSFTDFAFRVLVYLASHPDRIVSTAEISEAYDISAHHLGKVVHRLGQGGWVDVKRGRGGGIRLARQPEEIRLDEVVIAFEPDLDLVECFGTETNHCPIAPVCGFTSILTQARGAFLETLRNHTLASTLETSAAAYRRHFLV